MAGQNKVLLQCFLQQQTNFSAPPLQPGLVLNVSLSLRRSGSRLSLLFKMGIYICSYCTVLQTTTLLRYPPSSCLLSVFFCLVLCCVAAFFFVCVVNSAQCFPLLAARSLRIHFAHHRQRVSLSLLNARPSSESPSMVASSYHIISSRTRACAT